MEDNSSDNSGNNSSDNNSGNNSSDNNSGNNSSDNNDGNNSADNSTSGQAVSADLGVLDIKVSHNNMTKIWDNVSNTVTVNVTNSGPNDAGNFSVELYEGELLLKANK